MEKSRILKTFNDHFGEFLDDIIRVFPNDNDLVTCRQALLTMRKMNPRIIITVFQNTVVGPYRKEIESNDLTFFIEKDYNKDLSFQQQQLGDQVLQKIDLIRNPVRNMCDEDKSKVLKYMNNLSKLCDLYNS